MIPFALALAAGAASPVAATGDGPVRGQALPDGGAIFRGVRYARPPVGPLRWRPPEPPDRRSAPVDAVAPHAACPQVAYGDWNRADAANTSEDCLFLDVRTPAPKRGTRLPVLVWIHGGGNRAGSGGGTAESRITEGGIVLVSVQYRLGALGFMSHPALSAEQGGASGNYGLLDQRAALRWVRANIAAFGGDPDRVTIAGESAGAQDVGLHLLSPGSRGLFGQAIAESGTPGFGVPPRSLAQNERLGVLIAARAGSPAEAGAARLRALPVAAVLAAQEAVDVPDLADDSSIWLQAVVDGRVLREPPAAALAAGRVNPARVVIGVNARELTLHGGAAAVEPTIRREFGARAERALAFYGVGPGRRPADDPRLGDVATQLADDLTFRCPTVAVSDALASLGAPVWQYQFDYAPPGGEVAHASELRYVFGQVGPGEPPMRRYWVNFVRTGDPNGAGLAWWPGYRPEARAFLSFEQAGPVARSGLRDEVCRLRDAP